MRRLLFGMTLMLAACGSDIVAPGTCTIATGCAIDGIDLAVVSLSVDSSSLVNRFGTIAVVDAHNLELSVLLKNRGTQSAPSGQRIALSAFGVTDTSLTPALAPGDSAVLRTTLRTNRAYFYGGNQSELQSIKARLLYSDADESNNSVISEEVAGNVPFVKLVVIRDTLQTARVNQFVSLRLRTQLDFGFMSGLEARDYVSLMFCLRAAGKTCAPGGWQALQRLDQNLYNISGAFATINATNAANPISGMYEILTCVVPRSHPGMQIDPANPDHHCEVAGELRVIP